MENDWSALVQTLTGHSTLVTVVAFSPDDKQVASASWSKTIILWDVANYRKFSTNNQMITACTSGLILRLNIESDEINDIVRHK